MFQGTLSTGEAVCTRCGESRSVERGEMSRLLQPMQSMLVMLLSETAMDAWEVTVILMLCSVWAC